MPPPQLGPYTIAGTLGKGGMGAVYEATDRRTGKQVAVKTLATHLGDDPTLRRRLLAEIEVLKALGHPGIVRLLAFGEEDGCPYFAMELVRGRSLEQILRAGRRFDWRETVDVALAVTRALKSAHDHGVVHRDLKPANLLFPDEAPAECPVKLADFGIARLFGGSDQTLAGTVVGTAEYMAPEQAAGNPLDHRVDLYALGLVIHAMLTGHPPFRGSDASEVLRRQRTETPPRLSAMVPDVPPALDDLVDRLLAKDPSRRPASALAVGRLLSAVDGSAAAHESGAVAAATPATAPRVLPAPPYPADGSVDLLGPTLAGPPATAQPGAEAARPVDGDSRTTSRLAPAATDGAASGSLARRLTEADRRPDAAAGRSMTSRFVTLEELHEAAREAEASRAWRDMTTRLVAGIGIVAILAFGGYAVLRKPTADELEARIMTLFRDPKADLRDARPLIAEFLASHGDDPRANAIRDIQHRIDLNTLEVRVRRRMLGTAPLPPVEREYRAAMERAAEGPQACLDALEAVLALHSDAPTAESEAALPPEERTSLWLDLVRRRIDQLRVAMIRDRQADLATAAEKLTSAEALAAEAAATTDVSLRDDLDRRRRELLTGLVDLYGDKAHMAETVARARALVSEMPVPAEEAAPP